MGSGFSRGQRDVILKLMIWLPNLKRERIYLIDATDIPLRAVQAVVRDDTLFMSDYSESYPDVPAETTTHPTLQNTKLYTEELRKFLSRENVSKNSKVIFLHNGSNAATFNAKVRLEKQRSDIPLSGADLPRIFGRATSQFFNQFGIEAKKRFVVDDIDLVLSSNRILDLKLDGETHINLAGVMAKRADVAIEQTFLRREIHEAINDTLPRTCSVLHVEIGAALHALAKLSGDSLHNTLFVYATWNKTHLYTTPAELLTSDSLGPSLQYHDDFVWGTRNFFEVLSDRLGVPLGDVDSFLTALNNGKASLRFTSLVKKVSREAFSEYIKQCHAEAPEAERVLFFMQEPLASFLEGCHFSSPVLCIIMASLHRKDIVQHEIELAPQLSPRALSPAFLAGFIAYLGRLRDNYLGAENHGNIKWLISHKSL